MQAWNFLATKNGDVDWAGFPLVAAALGISDPERLMQQLLVIKSHRPPEV